MQLRVLAFVLAGGKGTRLYPLTKERAKPAVPFGGRYRIVDFVLSNLINSGIYSIYVLVQFKSQSLLEHLREGWEASSLLRNHFIIPVPAQMRSAGEDWYRGTADAIYQNINLIEQAEPHVVAIFGADHIYRMNIREMIEFHIDRGAQVTVSAIPVEKEQAVEFGVVETREDGLISGFHEKKPDAPTMPGDPNRVYASMGNYLFSTKLLLDELRVDGEKEHSSHDFGRDILPGLIGRADMYAYDFQTNRIPGDPAGRARLLAGRGNAGRILRCQHGPAVGFAGAKSIQSRSGRCAPPDISTPRPNSSSTATAGAARRWIPSSPAEPSFPEAGPDLGDRPRRAHSLPCLDRGFHHFRQLRHRPARPRPAGHSGQERARSARHLHRLRSGTRPPALSCHRERNRGGGRLPLAGRHRQHESVSNWDGSRDRHAQLPRFRLSSLKYGH